MDIGIIGYGTVGKAIFNGFKDKTTLYVFDPIYFAEQAEHFKSSIEEVWYASDFIFIAIPTPQKLTSDQLGGPFDSSNIDQLLAEISPLLQTKKSAGTNKVLIIVSTTLPSKVKEYLNHYSKLNLVMLPEFLTEQNAQHEFLNPKFRIIGGEPEHTRAVHQLFEKYSICASCKVGYCDAIGAAFIKYMINSYLAVKVSFLNQFYDLFQQSDSTTDWKKLSELLHYETRMGNSHKEVPGYDGDRGWGGKCLPKDVNAIMRDAEKQGYPLKLLEEAWRYNLSVRSKIDWK